MTQDHGTLGAGVLIVDFGSQTTLLIARRLREMGVYTEVWPCTDARLEAPPGCLGLILSGGPSSVADVDSPRLARALLETGRPVLGICYGMQLIVEHFGGRVSPGHAREFGRTTLALAEEAGALLEGVPRQTVVWMSHSDAMSEESAAIRVTARSQGGAVAAVEIEGREVFGVQFHPEVTHTEQGERLLDNFARRICGAQGRWSPRDMIEASVDGIRAQVGEAGKVICGLSGGVDSTVAAALIARAIGPRLVCLMVDTGLMRQGEVETVAALFRERFGEVELRVIDAAEDFIGALAGVSDPEQKRKIIGRVFIEVFEREARAIDGVTHLAQGTLYPDVIESVSVRGPSAVIKSHHNVGGLPDRLPFALLEPLRTLFKDEVRLLGEALDIPKTLTGRHPFPGPGLAIRILGEVTRERLELVRRADHIFTTALVEEGHYDAIWQAFAVLLPIQTVGVMGDARTYEAVAALRAVTSRDGMTADMGALPLDFLHRVSNRIINEVRGINRVVYDLTSKPPATIEWE